MATALTESEEDTDTETEPPEGERLAAVGSDSTSEASTNTPVHVSQLFFRQLYSNERCCNKNT